MKNDLAIAFRAGREQYVKSQAQMKEYRDTGRNFQRVGFQLMKTGISLMVGVLLLIILAALIF